MNVSIKYVLLCFPAPAPPVGVRRRRPQHRQQQQQRRQQIYKPKNHAKKIKIKKLFFILQKQALVSTAI